ncbi:nucleoside hydrolase [Treponema parvum]|uniref:Nucleoside hydrolase n=1 Tax=Treponema parvum TaxID=138851 RepID=A0A975EYC9_9SPIR|nr:nucleoside hydrolase [Treponema parvum]QTQ11186.1 nucleoside hydrolase [Treponema parvum]
MLKKTPIIFDCDPGHDDAIALILALSTECLDIKAITTVAGNSSIENTTSNALKILEKAGRNDIPVAKGASKPILAPFSAGVKVHGASGMDGPVLPEPETRPCSETAVELMGEIIEQSLEPVTLIVTGPCTNIAIFMSSYPHLIKKIERISMMGGGFQMGNRSSVGEFNIWQDPEAAQIVMKSGVPVEIYPLDVTHKALILKEEFDLFRNAENEISEFVAQLLDFFSVYYTGIARFGGCPMHDACAVAGIINPRMFTYKRCYAQVDIDGHYSRGGMDIDIRGDARRKKSCNGKVALDIDRKIFLTTLLKSCEILAAQKRKKKI